LTDNILKERFDQQAKIWAQQLKIGEKKNRNINFLKTVFFANKNKIIRYSRENNFCTIFKDRLEKTR